MELFGSKIKALIERHTCRDLYDVYKLLHSDLILTVDISLLRKIVVFYLAVGGNKKLSKEYDLSSIKQIKFSQIRATLLPMLRKGESFDFETAKVEVIEFLERLLSFTDTETAFIDYFVAKQYRPELLFNDDVIIAAVESRTSSPVRIPRNDECESNIVGLFPCGEGSGYAGGITTAAMDGLKIAEAVAKKYKAFK